MLVDLFSSKKELKVIDFLLDEPEHDFCKKDLVKELNVSWPGLSKFMDKLERFKVITMVRKIKGTKMYILNRESEIWKALFVLDNKVSLELVN